MIEEKLKSKQGANNVIIENRGKISVSGVLDVTSFDEESILLETDLGLLILKGQDFRINKLNVDIGELAIEGYLDTLEYSDGYSKSKGGLFSRMFK